MQKSKTIYALLGWLMSGPKSGYDLKKLTEQYIGEFWYGSFGQIYPLLHEMHRGGLVSLAEEVGKGPKRRKVYAVTEAGTREFRRWARHEPEPEFVRSELLLRIFFGRYLPLDILRDQIEQLRDEQRVRLERFQELDAQLDRESQFTPYMPYVRITLNRGLIVARGFVEWAEQALWILEETERSRESER
ncbi:PadR family transcriptional regulator [bacterium]|nr:PadR family transcriptional regulator [bacterium]MBU1982834.1 PadR family transcriptional regulator [bacterium]